MVQIIAIPSYNENAAIAVRIGHV